MNNNSTEMGKSFNKMKYFAEKLNDLNNQIVANNKNIKGLTESLLF